MLLAVLDQTSIFSDAGPGVAVRETVDLAREVERLGYRRFWIAEHHGPTSGCGSPEILVAAAGEATTTLRVGTGAVLLPYYKPLKVATTFNLLSRLFPGRIDLGVGRGPGAGPATAYLLGGNGPSSFEPKLSELVRMISDDSAAPQFFPKADRPELWVMGSGGGSVHTAARLGLPFSFAQFIHDRPKPEVADQYRAQFTSGDTVPRFSLCVRVACADSREDALALGALAGWLQTAHVSAPSALKGTMPSWSELRELAAPSGPPTASTLIGTPSEVQEQLGELIAAYRPDELAVTTACPRFDLRVRTFELIQEMCGALVPAG
ncbi:LLM class flavin-dependent oxidoreductase [Sphaerisporangium flaviroseum]|uniref:LLM class flavin-dependent oxidoreductase n=1 Tax=Sphaerisporangium flaviroseum TaxID=509199 RepID=A0ABP7J931_9ACTN